MKRIKKKLAKLLRHWAYLLDKPARKPQKHSENLESAA